MLKLVTFHAPICILLVLCAAMSIILFVNVEDGKAADPANPDNYAALAASVHGGPLPDLYAPMHVELVAVEHGVERTSAADIHTVTATFLFHGDPRLAQVWLMADRAYTRSNCEVSMSGMGAPAGGSTVAACFVLPPGEEPSAAIVASGDRRGVFEIGREMFAVMPLPLFGAPAPPGLACESSANGTVCAPPGA